MRRLLFSFAMLVAAHADADPLAVANQLRSQDCKPRSARIEPFKEDAQVVAVAERWSRGGRLAGALPQGYGANRFVSLNVNGARDDRALMKALRQQWCSTLADATFTRFGAYRRGADYWIVLASGDESPKARDANALRSTALQLVNEARAQKRRCGPQSFDSAPPLKLNAVLNRAAETHATNMAKHGKLQHEGFDGSTPGDRARAAGYSWRAIAENIAAGPTTAEEVVKLWLDSPGHCANIMSGDYTEMGLAFAVDADAASGVYWAQEFGRGR